jgi:hypothetical protein
MSYDQKFQKWYSVSSLFLLEIQNIEPEYNFKTMSFNSRMVIAQEQ